MQFWKTNDKLEKSYFPLPVLYSELQYGGNLFSIFKFIKILNLKIFLQDFINKIYHMNI